MSIGDLCICVVCGKQFNKTTTGPQKFCSNECKRISLNERRKKEKKEIKCIICGNIFKSSKDNAKYCSQECKKKGINKNCNNYWHRQHPQREVICKKCGKPFLSTAKNAAYCSKWCHDHRVKNEQRKKYCIDCGIEISYYRDRCKSCAVKNNWENNYEKMYNAVFQNFGKSGFITQPERDWQNFIEESTGEIVENQFTGIHGYRFDLKVGNILIDVDPTWSHNSSYFPYGKPLDERYHQRKSLAAEQLGYHCIHLFDWDNNTKVKAWLVGLIKKRKRLYHGDIRKISHKEAEIFYDDNHLQGRCHATVHYGLFIKGQLINAMSFTNFKGEWTLVRFASLQGYRVAHGAEKLFNTFIKEYNPSNVISFSDITKHSGGLYDALGFKIEAINAPSYWRVGNGDVYRRRDCQKKNMHRLKGFDHTYKYLEHEQDPFRQQTEKDLMESHGYVKVCDAGMRRHVRYNPNKKEST